MTLEAGRISTWRLPRFSALKMLRRQSFSTEMRTILPGSEHGSCQRTWQSPESEWRRCCRARPSKPAGRHRAVPSVCRADGGSASLLSELLTRLGKGLAATRGSARA